MKRSYKRYSLNELLYIIFHLEDGDLKDRLQRSVSGLRSKLSRSIEDGRTSLRSVKQYKNFARLYEAFGEVFPEDGMEDIKRRVKQFEKVLEMNEYIRDVNGNILYIKRSLTNGFQVLDKNGSLLGMIRDGSTFDKNGNLLARGEDVSSILSRN